MAYSFQTFSVSQVLTATQMNQVEVNIRDHVHGVGGVLSTNLPLLNFSNIFTAVQRVESAKPAVLLKETDASLDNKVWRLEANAEGLRLTILNDDEDLSTDILEINRTGLTVDTINFNNGTLQSKGNDVYSTKSTTRAQANVTITSTLATIAIIDLGTVAVGDEYLVSAEVNGLKNATGGGDCKGIVQKSSGTATIVFEHDLSSASISAQGYEPANSLWGFNMFGIMRVTVAGTLILKVSGQSVGGDSVSGSGAVVALHIY